MATEAEIPESIISVTKREEEIIYSASGHSTVNDPSPEELKKIQEVLNVSPEIVECSGETKNTQEANDVGAEATNTVIKVDVETPEGERFLGSPLAVEFATEDTCRVSKNPEPEEITIEAGNETLESNKQVEVAAETRTVENKVTDESEDKPEKNMSHDIANLRETSLQMAKIEDIEEESFKEESITVSKEPEKSINLMNEVPEATKPSERAADEDEKEISTHEGAEETSTSAEVTKSDEEATLKISKEAGYEAAEKLQEASSISCDEKLQDKIEPSKKMECMTPVEDEMKHKNDMDTSALQMEETHLQKVDNTEPLKVVPKIWPDESPDEVKEQIEISEKTEKIGSTSNETVMEYEGPERKGDGSFVKHEATSSVNEVQPAKEASSGENIYEEEIYVTVTNDNTADAETIDAFEHKQSGASNSEERAENLQQNEPEKEKLEGSLNAVAEALNIVTETITSFKNETPIKSQEKSYAEEMKRDLPDHTDANLPPIELSEKAECADVEVPNKTANDLHVAHALVEEAGENEVKNLDKIFNSESEGKIREAYEAYKEEKQIEDTPEACLSANSTILEQASVAGTETTELIPKASETDREKLQEASGPEFEETVTVDKAENPDQETQKTGEACDTVTQEISANSADAGKCVIYAEASVEVNNSAARDEEVEQNIQVESPLEAVPEFTGQDKSCRAEDNDKSNNITNEEVIEGKALQISPESIDIQNVESCQGSKNLAGESKGENEREQVTEESTVPESVEQVSVNNVRDEKKEAEESTKEILENSYTAEAVESITHETIENIESPKDILDGSSVQQGKSLQSEERNLTSTDTSPEEEKSEVSKKNDGDPEPNDDKDNREKKTAESEEDLKNISETNEAEKELPSSSSITSGKNEAFSSDADKTPGDVQEGATQNLKETLQKEENENETEVKNDTRCSKLDIEEDLERIAETSDTSKNKESMVFEPNSEVDNIMVEDEIKKEESEELNQASNDGGKDEEIEKQNIKEECSPTNILPEPMGEASLQSSKEEKVDQSVELEEEKIEQRSQGDEFEQVNDTYISPLSIAKETVEDSEGNENEAENTGANDTEEVVEETNSRSLVPKSVEQSPLKNLEDDKMKEDESTGEIFGNSKTSEGTETAAHYTSTTTGSTTEILDTSPVKKGESLENEEKNQTATESSAEEKRNEDRFLGMVAEENINHNELLGAKDNTEKKPSVSEEDLQCNLQENEPAEKHERSISVMPSENEAFTSIADKTPCPTEEGTSQDLGEAQQKVDNVEETEEKNDNEDNKIMTEEVNADKTPCLTEEGTSQDFNEAPQNEDNDRETEEKSDTEDNKIAKEENLEKVAESSHGSKNTENVVLELKSEKDKMLVQDEIKEESEELYDNSEKSGKSDSEKHDTLEECGTTNDLPEMTEEKTHQSFDEGKEEVPLKTEVCEELVITTTNVGEDVEKQIIEENAVEQSRELEENLQQSSKEDNMAAKTSDQEASENSKTSGVPENAAIETSATIESTTEILDTSMVKQEESLDNKEKNQTATESSAEEKRNEASCPVMVAEGNNNDNGLLREKDNSEKKPLMGEEDLQHTLQENEPEENYEPLSSVISNQNEAFSSIADRTACLREEGTSHHLDEAPPKEDDKESEEKNDAEDNGRAMEENLEIFAESSDSSKSTQSIALEPKSEKDKMLAQDEIKNEKSIELYEDSKNAGKSESEKHNTLEECAITDILLEPTEDKTHKSFEEGKEEETLKTEVCVEPDATSVAEDAAEKQIAEGESTVEPSRELEVKKVEQSSKENDMAAKTSKEEECEITQIANEAEDTGRQNIEKGRADDENFELLARGTDNEDTLVKNNEEKEYDKQAFEPEVSSTAIEKEDIVEETVGENSKEDERTTLKLKDQVDDSNLFIEDTEATRSAEDRVSQTLKDRAETDVNTKESEAETPIIETNEGLTEESAMVVHSSNKESEQKIKKKEETTAEDLDSASTTVVTEEKGLQETKPEDIKQEKEENTAEDSDSASTTVGREEKGLQETKPEDIKQVDSSAPTFKGKDIEETESKETTRESVDISGKPEETSDLGKKSDSQIPTVANKAGETNEGLIKESAMVSNTPTEGTEEEIAEKEEIIIEDPYSVPGTVVTEAKSLQEAKLEVKEQVQSVAPTFEEKGKAEMETKEAALESVDNNLKPEVTSDLVEKRDNEILTVADTGRETNEGIIEESSMGSQSANKETEEEIKEKEETSIKDSDSASLTVVTEEKGLQEAEPEEKKQVESVVPASEDKGIAEVETKETTLESVDFYVKPEDATNLGEMRDNEIPTAADKAGETNEGLAEESAMVSPTTNKETEEEIEEKEETTMKDSGSEPITVVTESKRLQEAEPEDKKQLESVGPAFEEKGMAEIETKETTLESEDINENSEGISYLGEKRDKQNPAVADKAGEEIKEKEETSIDDSDSASITVVTEQKCLQEAEPEEKKQVESVVPASEETGMVETETKETTPERVEINAKPEDTTDLGEKRDNWIPTVTNTAGETREGLVEESTKVLHTSDKETEEIKEKEDIVIDGSDSASVTAVIEAKDSQEAEPEDKKHVESVVPASEETGRVETETKETTPEIVEIRAKPEDTTVLGQKRDNEIPTVTNTAGETHERIIEECAKESHTSDKGTEEIKEKEDIGTDDLNSASVTAEIKEKEDIGIDGSDSASVTAVIEAKDSQEAEPEDKKHVESVVPASEEKGMAEIETKETTLESVHINVKAEVTSDFGEKRDREIPGVADEVRETIDSEIQNDVRDAGSEDHSEVTILDKPSEEISEDDLKEYSTIASEELEHTTTEVSGTVDRTPAQDQGPFENTRPTSVAKGIDGTLMNKQDTTRNPVNVSELESLDIEKETANEDLQKQKVEPDLENAQNLSNSEDVEISKGEETGKLADQGDVCKSTTSKDVESLNLGVQMEKTEDQEPLDKTSKTMETSGVCIESEKAIAEQEISKCKPEEVEVESAPVQLEAEVHSQRHEDVNNTDDGSATEENLECTSESVAENQTRETLPESEKIQTEESNTHNQNQEDDEPEEKEESQLEAEEHKEQNANETSKEQEGAGQPEDIKELVAEEEHDINELHASSIVDKTIDEMENSTPVSSEYDKADLKEQMKAENSKVEEHSARETEASLTRESEEQQAQDVRIGPDMKELKEKIGETVEEPQDGYNMIDDATVTAKTETSSGEAELGDKIVKDFHIEATEAENGQQGKEVDNVKLEETSELASELPLNDNGHAKRETLIVENRDITVPDEAKIAFETVSVSRDLGTEPGEASVGESQIVGKPGQNPTNNDDNAGRENVAVEDAVTDEDEEAKIVSNVVDEIKDLGAEETSEAVKGPTAENMDQIQTGDREHTQEDGVTVENPKADEVNEIKAVSKATFGSNGQETEESASEIPAVENRDVGEPEETKIASAAVIESRGQGAEGVEVGKSQTVRTPDQEPDNYDDNEGRENAAVENSGANEVEETKTVGDEIKVVADTIYESKGRDAEEGEVEESQTVGKPDQVPTNDDDNTQTENEATENSRADEVEQVKTISDAVEGSKDQGLGEAVETGKSPIVEKMDQITTSGSKHAQKEGVTVEYPKADEVKEIKLVSHTTYESNGQDTEASAEEIPTDEKLDQVLAENSEQAEEGRVTIQYPDAAEVKEQITQNIDEAEKNPDSNKIEEASKAASDIEAVTENKIIADQTASAEALNAQHWTPTSTLTSTHEIIATVQKIEEEKLEDQVLEDSSAAKPTEETCLQTGSRELGVSALLFSINKHVKDNPNEEEGKTSGEALKLDKEKIKCVDSSSESKANMDLTGPAERGYLESETSEKAFQSEAVIHSHEKPTESEDVEIKHKHQDVVTDVTEEDQCKKTCESNEITENKVSKEEIPEEKEVAETRQPISLGEETMNKSLQEQGLKFEEYREDGTDDAFKTTVNEIQHEEPFAETEKATASGNIREQVAAEDTSFEDSDQASVENKTIKESFPQEFEGKDIEDSANKLEAENQGEERNFGSGKLEVTTPRDEQESSMYISEKESDKQPTKDGELTQETREIKESSYATNEKQIPTEADLIERPATVVQTGNEHAPPVGQEGIIETPRKAETGDLKPGDSKGVHSEAEVKHGGEQITDCSGEETTEGPVLVDSAKPSLSDLLQRSRKETTRGAKLVSQEIDPTQENETVKPEVIQVKEAKRDEEKEEEDGDEHNRTDSASDAPVMVEASKDMDVKAAHKKSHNILSGVGSKVKHSISKVKKAITGKSSHPKPVSPK